VRGCRASTDDRYVNIVNIVIACVDGRHVAAEFVRERARGATAKVPRQESR